MASQTRKAFDENTKDIERLLELHKKEGGIKPGYRFGLEVLNKSAIVLITSYWEAYCEDIAAEALKHIITYGKTSDVLPIELKKHIAKDLEKDLDELAAWRLSDEGWKSVLKSRLAELTEERNRKLNTPKSAQIDDLFLKTIGIKQISNSWKWPTIMTPDRARSKLLNRQ